MRWQGDRSDVEDLRGRGIRGVAPIGIGGLILVAALSYFTGTDFFSMLGNVSGPDQSGAAGEIRSTPEEERLIDFVGAVAKDTQDTWARLLGPKYQRTSVGIFREATETACGTADTATGPFYCPGDRKVYLDLSFFKELSDRFGAPGDFAQAYVIAHEIGHHVQTLTGASGRVRDDPRPGAGSASVALELQADCYAGVWGHAASQSGRFAVGQVELDPGDTEEALRAAASIGDDRLQKMASGRVAPERFTHGTSAQRVEWFRRGMETGDPAQCNTFNDLSRR
jgi:predicted metalloprotease